MALLNAAGVILASRFILLLAVVGGFILAYMATLNPVPMTLIANAIFDALIILPLVVLYLKKG